MKPRLTLELADVQKILEAAQREALANQWVVSITVVDDGGALLGALRLDGAAPMTAGMSMEKARTAALGRRETRVFEEMINGGRTAFVSAPGLHAMVEGGVPILFRDECVGAVGVSGVKSAQDAQIARAGIAALG